MYALVDCNTFYASCERIFRPDLKNKPIVILSNNDGCAISMSNEAKLMGIGVGDPYYEFRDKNLVVLSSNYALYENISTRVMLLLQEFTPFLEVYSIDEAFLDFSQEKNPYKHGLQLKKEVMRQVGIPVCVGIARTKVLAKLANRVAKKNTGTGGVVHLFDQKEEDKYLQDFPLKDVWGIGYKLKEKLKSLGLKTAKDLRDYDNKKTIQSLGTKKLRQIQDELKGIACHELLENEKKDNIGSSRSFGRPVSVKAEMKEAVASYLSRAAAKMRAQDSVTDTVSLYIHTNHLRPTPQHSDHAVLKLPEATQDTRVLIQAGMKLVDQIYKTGYPYKKAGVELHHLRDKNEFQMSLFQIKTEDESLMKVMDEINERYGRDKIRVLACGTTQPWKMLSEHRSPEYTTKIFEAPDLHSPNE